MEEDPEIKSSKGKEVALEADEMSYKMKYFQARDRFEKIGVLVEMISKIRSGQKFYAEDVAFFRDLKENCLDPSEAELLETVFSVAEAKVRKTQEEEKELGSRLMKWKEQAKVLKRRSDFLHLILSYPMKPETEKKIQPCLGSKFSIINEKIRNFEASKLNRYNARYHYESHEDFSKEIEDLLDEFEEDLDSYDFDMAPYLPQDMKNMRGPPAAAIKSSTSKPEPAELIKSSKSTKSENASRPYEDDMLLGAPEVIRKLAINSAVDQISEYFEDKKFGKIGVSGSGWEEVVKALEDLPKIRNTFDIVQSFSLSQHQTIRRLIAQTRGPSKISTSPSRSTRLLLLVDCTDQETDLHYLLDVVNDGISFVLKTQPLHVDAMLAVDLEIRMEDHLIPWTLFCNNVGRVLDHFPTLEETAVRLIEKCHRHLLAIILLARALKDDVQYNAGLWELALQELMWQPSSHVKGMNVVMINVLRFIWDRMGTPAKNCVKYYLLHQGQIRNSLPVIKHAITNGWIETKDEGEHILEALTTSFLIEKGHWLRMREETRVVLLNIFIPGKDPAILKQGDLGLTKTPKAKEWVVAKEIYLMNNKLSVLPESPNCPFLVKLLLQGNHDLMVIPPSFFECMPVLEVLDLSYTNIKSLPKSISKLLALRQFFLKGCDLLMELPPEIGKLTNLEVFDLQGTEIMYLPKEIGKLVKLTKLWVFFNECADLCKENKDVNAIIPEMALSSLSQLSELSIEVHPHGDWWDVELGAIIHELRSLKDLTTLKLYLPVVELLKELRWHNTSLTLKRFQLIVGRHEQRFISRLPHEVKEEFNNFEKGLKYINGEGKEIPTEITKVLKQANAFFLERHWTVKNLSDFGLENMKKLEFCCLVECNEFQTIIDVEGEGEGECDEFEHDSAFDEKIVLGEEDEDDESEHNSDFVEEIVFGSLQYLSIHYMKNMESIWKGPFSEDSLYRLKSLALHTCPKLTSFFTRGMLHNLRNLKELIVEDCPKINSLVSFEASGLESVQFLPSLKKISLLELPELANISRGLRIAPKLESMVIFYCPKLKMLSRKEVSSKNLKVIKGENEWWDSLKWQSGLDHHDYLASKFIPLRMDRDLLAQLTTDQINSNLQGNVETYISGQVVDTP